MSVTSIEHICTYIQDVFNSAAFEFLKKAPSTALTRHWLELKQIIGLMLQDILNKHGIYTRKMLFEGRLSLTYLSSIKMNNEAL